MRRVSFSNSSGNSATAAPEDGSSGEAQKAPGLLLMNAAGHGKSWNPAELEQIRVSMYEDRNHESPTKVIREDSYTVDDEGKREEKLGSSDNMAKLGTLTGVFLPTVQNILGVILFLRLPFITGQAGTFLASVIVVLSVGSSILTSISLSALVTNGKIAEGGPYYILSRNLGPAAGGAIGILFYLATVIASSMYMLGGIEVIQTGFLASAEGDYEEQFPFETQLSAISLAVFLSSIVFFGVEYVKKSAFFFLAAVLICIVLLVLGVVLFASGAHSGALEDEDRKFGENFFPDYEENPDTGITPDFFFLLSVFYPSVTDPLQGANLSGVLRDPSKSIPSGTLAALCFTSTVYFLVVWLFGLFVANETLKDDKLVAANIAWPVAVCVQVGILLSTVGAGLQSLASAPRLLAAIAYDRTVPFLNQYVELQVSPGTNPHRAIVLTCVLCCLPCLAGNLDFIVPFITELFLLMYTAINFSCFLLSVMRAPSWRPAFKYYHWSVSLFGTLYCFTLMIIISWYSALCVIFLASLLVLYIKTQDASRNWGDAIKGLRYNLARDQLLALESRTEFHAKNWRPQLLLMLDKNFATDPQQIDLLSFAGQLKKGRGLLMIVSYLLPQDPQTDREEAAAKTRCMVDFVRDFGIDGFCRVITAKGLSNAVGMCLDLLGLGTLRPNALLVGWRSNVENLSDKEQEDYVNSLKNTLNSRKTLLVLKGEALSASNEEDNASTRASFIDIWWVVHDGGVMLLIPYLLKLHKNWRNCRLRLFSVVTSKDASYAEVEERTRMYLERVRIPAEVIPIFFEGDAEYVYRRSTQVPEGATVRLKTKILDKLALPSTMTVAVRGPRREEPRRRSSGDLRSLFNLRQQGSKDSEPIQAANLSQKSKTSPTATSKGVAAQVQDPKSLTSPSCPSAFVRGVRAGGTTTPQAPDSNAGSQGQEENRNAQQRFKPRLSVTTAPEPDDNADSPDFSLSELYGPTSPKIQGLRGKRLTMANFMNNQMMQYSSEARLVVTNLPLRRSDEHKDTIDYVETMTKGLKYVLLVRGAGNEVVTAYA